MENIIDTLDLSDPHQKVMYEILKDIEPKFHKAILDDPDWRDELVGRYSIHQHFKIKK